MLGLTRLSYQTGNACSYVFIVKVYDSPVANLNRRLWLRGVLLIRIIVGQGPSALTEVAVGGLFGHFFLSSIISLLSPSLWETARYRLKYCLKGPLNPNEPTN